VHRDLLSWFTTSNKDDPDAPFCPELSSHMYLNLFTLAKKSAPRGISRGAGCRHRLSAQY